MTGLLRREPRRLFRLNGCTRGSVDPVDEQRSRCIDHCVLPHAPRTNVLGEIRNECGLILILDLGTPRAHLRHRSTPRRRVFPLLNDQGGTVAQQASLGHQRLR